MPELPDRPDLDQLRRQARELLRAATGGEPHAVSRIRAVSERCTLATAQLAVAREHGYRSWPALKAEVERRRSLASAGSAPAVPEEGAPADALGERWSFGGATPITTSAGVLMLEALIAGAEDAVLYASLTPADAGVRAPSRPRRLPAPARPFARLARRRRARAVVGTMGAVAELVGEVSVADSGGTTYALHNAGSSGKRGTAGRLLGPITVNLSLEPVPGRHTGWLEVRSQDGTATRLQPSARAQVRLGQLTPTDTTPAERTLSGSRPVAAPPWPFRAG